MGTLLSKLAHRTAPILRVSVPLVVLDAVFSGKHDHRPVSGLSAKDFVLREVGRLRHISYLAQDKIPISIVFMIDLTQTHPAFIATSVVTRNSVRLTALYVGGNSRDD